ncbi:adenosylcobinamide-phosphate synthase CbiB [Lichenihabitans sp. Uapishka_5]|uniref:adenosylcobinamide-phosphate synthase CbiB n=1 Tax=Lichenihabitans sp. Uapishka_5 TaxID=3037302 RepID=UPI0029E7D6ED|nr:adenosylcobinamide-phosphate synthase CbiB [Lichenihabitans sp. Uapishka_5]MDX7950097.1 adenosylcobinamide-phosphate synthase CbiB [Lichenihabitans sp. Uapishka_5]
MLAAAALLVEAAFGYPAWLFRAVRHPVVWMGALLAWLDRRLNDPQRAFALNRLAGVAALLGLLGATAVVAWPFDAAARSAWGWILSVLAACSLPAQRSLHDHVRAVAVALENDGLAGGRSAVAMIVGRDVAALDEAGVVRAAIESLAENFADGVVAPAVWLALGGVTGGALYKAVNTADSMIGHRSDRYRAFGWAAARLDDLVNLPASRLAAVWLILAAALTCADAGAAVQAVQRDARHHRSPNAGWPEAAMAGALGIALAGPRIYGGTRVDDRFIGGPRREVTLADIRRALTLYRVAAALQVAVLLGVALALRR